MFRILHLSDIHIGKTYRDPEVIACKIASDIDFNGLSKIRCIAVTGDIFDGQATFSDSLINTVVTFFVTLVDEINDSQEEVKLTKNDVIFVPGNHDLIRVDDFKKRWSKYQKFLQKFYGEIPSFYNVNDYSCFKEYPEDKIVLIGFNSCQIEKKKLFDENYVRKFSENLSESDLKGINSDKEKIIELLRCHTTNEYDDYGEIPLMQIRAMEKKLKHMDDYNVVALFHHHFYLFPELAHKFGDSSIVRNYTEVIQHLKYMNVGIVLHGHKHFDLERPFIWDDYYNSPENIIDVFAGGSVGKAGIAKHTFSILDLYDKKDDIKLIHNKFVYNGESLEPIVRKQFPPEHTSGRIIKLLEILKTKDANAYNAYTEASEKAFKSYDNSCHIITWISEALTGFTDVYNFMDNDYHDILFLLYAVNCRMISYMNIVGNEKSYFDSASQFWNTFYDTNLMRFNSNVLKSEYHKLFEYKRLKGVTDHCDKLLNDCGSRKERIHLAFTMVGIFFTDLYLVLTKYADDFKESIKYKVNIKIEENKFHENVPASRIVIESDVDRRSVYINLLCNEATAHKMAVLFIKEFDLLINKFEDYFKLIGLKIYYLLPRIDKDRMKNTLDNYNFEAYIPTLLPLLTGDNIYSSKVVFARELIQNSIDAIAVREAKDRSDFSKKIHIEIKNDENGKRYFKIKDHGTGMDRYKIERYFTSIGRSFYSGEEYADLHINYKPISNFGIGFLSSFMVCKEIDVKTRYFEDDSEGLILHIPNYDGCFFIELDDNVGIGTELKLYLDDSTTSEDIVDYIKHVMQDIKYDICIHYVTTEGIEKHIDIPARSVQKLYTDDNFKFFIPFLENGEVKKISYEDEVLSNKYIENYDYGLLIKKRKDESPSDQLILNAGINIRQASLSGLFGNNFGQRQYGGFPEEDEYIYNDIIINFPANWLQLDVARDNITNFTNTVKYSNNQHAPLGERIAECLYDQIVQFMKTSDKRVIDLPAIYLQEIILYAIDFCDKRDNESYMKLNELTYIIKIQFHEKGVRYTLIHRENKKSNISITYKNDLAKQERHKWLSKFETRLNVDFSRFYRYKNYNGKMPIEKLFHMLVDSVHDDDIYTDRMKYKVDELLRNVHSDYKINHNSEIIYKLLTLFLLQKSEESFQECRKELSLIIFMLKNIILQKLKIGENEEINIYYSDLDELMLYLSEDDKETIL